MASDGQYDATVAAAHAAWLEWRMVPMPVRGEIVKKIGLELEAQLDPLSKLESMEVGKTYKATLPIRSWL